MLNKDKEIIQSIVQEVMVAQKKQEEEKIPERALEQPSTEKSPFGAEYGVTENLETNTKLIKEWCKNSQLKIVDYYYGSVIQNKVSLFYLEDRVDTRTLEEVQNKMSNLEIDYLLHVETIGEELQHKSAGLFPTVRVSERFDVIVSDLIQGKVIIIADHCPLAVIAPVVFWGFFHQQDDYYTRTGRFTLRILKILAFLFTIYGSTFFIVVQKFHLDQIDNKKIYELFNGADYILPALVQILLIMLVMRMAIVNSVLVYSSYMILISLLVTMIIGEMSVKINLLNPFIVVLMNLSILTSLHSLFKGLRPIIQTLEPIMLFTGYFFDWWGVAILSLIFFCWASFLKPYGIHYLSPIIPLKVQDLKDTLWRGKLKKIINAKHTYREK
ncbi:spore germination protein [Gottfriedia acidiceleris]|uniref:spore germination protein n=1 Tax=Gottfriedia acidiceleris TaxID=371036 RepID=UPI003D20A65A